jgi:hypothetical protein
LSWCFDSRSITLQYRFHRPTNNASRQANIKFQGQAICWQRASAIARVNPEMALDDADLELLLEKIGEF